MPLTADEQTELDGINAQLAQMDAEEAGNAAVARVQAARAPHDPPPARPWGTLRTAYGIVRESVQGALDTFTEYEVDKGYKRQAVLQSTDMSLRGIAARSLAALPFDFGADAAAEVAGVQPIPAAAMPHFELPKPDGYDQAGTAERMTRSIGAFLVPFTASMRAMRGLGAVGALGTAGKGLAAGAIADFTQSDPKGGNFANLIKDTFHLDNAALNALVAEPDDSAMEVRFKAATAGAITGIGAEFALRAGGQLLRGYRAFRGSAEEAAATVESLKRGPVKLSEANIANIDEGIGASRKAQEIPVVEADAIYDPVHGPAAMAARQEPKNFEDVLDFLKERAGNPNIDPEFSARLAKNLLEGDPENALAKLGIDPLKLDYSAYVGHEELLGRLQAGMAEVYGQIARGLGRTGERITAEATVRGAEALASTPEVLKALYNSTNHLAEHVMAARMFVGGHAHQLLDSANAAIKEIEAGGTGPAWAAFLEAFHRHAYFMGAVRGAGSEMGRALKSLQMLAKASPKTAQQLFDAAAEADAKAQAPKLSRLSIADGASAFADGLSTDAERLNALHKLVALRGDVMELSRAVREGNGSVLRRASLAIKETVGNLFTLRTAVMNVLSGATYLSTSILGKALAAAVRFPGLLLGGAAEIEARRAIVEAWAYTDGILSGFGEAFRNTIAVLEHEAYDELRINADGLGLAKLAKEAQRRSTTEYADATAHFERADVVNNKAFSLTAAESRRLREFADSVGGPQFFQMGLRGLTNILAGSVNAAGSLSRLGTTAFINLPDEFVGTLATRAGAYKKAVQIASREAADIGLEGTELGQYIKARAVQLFGDGPKGWSYATDAGEAHAIARAGEVEAKMVLFQDELDFSANRALFRVVASGGGPLSLIIPFIKTPLRILERTAVDFTPLGAFKDRIRWAIAAGGSARDEALARMSLGTLALFTAYQLAEDRSIVGYDGGFSSSARDAGRPMYSLKVGDETYQFSSLDPLGTLLGMGADLRTYLDANESDPAAPTGATEMAEGFLWAVAANVLSKTWLTSLRQLTDLAGATSAADADSRWTRLATGLATRVIPASGVQRQIEAWGNGVLRDAAGFSDGLLKASIGADQLPPKRDIVGREVVMQDTARATGLTSSIMPDDPLGKELESLSFQRPPLDRTQGGAKLTAAQYSRFLKIRGQEVRSPYTGLTLQEALDELVRLPEYQALPKAARVDEIRKTMAGYTPLAVDKLTDEDRSYALARLRAEVFTKANLEGWEPDQRDAALIVFADKLGIPHN